MSSSSAPVIRASDSAALGAKSDHVGHSRLGLPRPSKFALKCLMLWTAIGLVHGFCNIVGTDQGGILAQVEMAVLTLWMLFALALFLATVFDLVLVILRPLRFSVERILPSRFSVGQWNRVELRIRHQRRAVLELYLFDHLPEDVDYESMPLSVEVHPNRRSLVEYHVRPLTRGTFSFEKLQALYYSPLKFWLASAMAHLPGRAKVYPDTSVLANLQYELDHRSAPQSGLLSWAYLGHGMQFHQLRHYQTGDVLRQVDWKATSRVQKMISKEYQMEREQTLVFLLDSGRRMRVKDDELSHFDHALNAVLLLVHVALQQGDSVGLLTFGAEERWIPPAKSSGQFNQIMNLTYDLHAQPIASDYRKAVQRLIARQQRRSVVILITNARDENLDELAPALNTLQQKHAVLVANLQEQSVVKQLDYPIVDFSDAMKYLGACHYLEQRQAVHQQLLGQRLAALDVAPAELPRALVNYYYLLRNQATR